MRPTAPLRLAIWLGKVEHVRALLNAGANTEATCKSWSEQTEANYALDEPEASHTALHHAIHISSPIEVVNLLLEHHADFNSLASSGYTFLHLVVMSKTDREGEKLLAALLRHSAKIVVTDGGSPLHLAAKNGNRAMAQLLLKHGARFNETAPLEGRLWDKLSRLNSDAFRDGGGKTPLWLAAECGHHRMVEMFLRSDTFVAEGRPDSIECVSDCSTHPLVRGLIACTALQIATAHSHTETAKVLLEKGVYIDRPFAYYEIGWGTSRHPRRESLLHLAIARSDLSNVQLFIDRSWCRHQTSG